MSISLVIRCYNEERHIGRLLSGVLQQTGQDVEIIVVDSGSTDATLSIVSNYPVKLLSIAPEDFSFGRSLNIGCEAATRDFIVIASAHVYPTYQDWLERLVAPFSIPSVALAYGKQRGDGTSKYSEKQLLAKWFPDHSNQSQEHPFCNNANAAIRRSLWHANRYDEALSGLEDLHWANRAMELGYQIAYVAEAEVVHVHNESPAMIYNRYRREAIAMKHIFPQERFGLWDFLRLFVANVISDCRHAWRDRVFLNNVPSIFGFRLMQFWGTYRGFARRGPITGQLKRTFYYPQGLRRAGDLENAPTSRRRVEYGGSPAEQPANKRD
jgi:glycosyltransferase involved in cell wall biosynthesis